jgi:hypothetical protein
LLTWTWNSRSSGAFMCISGTPVSAWIDHTRTPSGCQQRLQRRASLAGSLQTLEGNTIVAAQQIQSRQSAAHQRDDDEWEGAMTDRLALVLNLHELRHQPVFHAGLPRASTRC